MEIGFAVLVVVGICELILAGFWVGFYLRNGIPLFSSTIPCAQDQEIPLSADELSDAYSRGLLAPLIFRSLRPGEMAFREKMLHLSLVSYTPIMRGHIVRDEGRGTLTVRGYAYAWPLCFLGVFVSMPLQGGAFSGMDLMFPAVALLIVALCYGIQARRYCRLVQMLREEIETRRADGGGPAGDGASGTES